ncbi:unnamed protein product [Arctia plantaginis]|uniref:Uncharacterized protein n=1 Tax=Arctia plantaginis TaxID=874455 RepID=A0A8S1B2I0_ARCPL|nr:unnamed protein product [Arctia plantaginis]
MTLRKCHRLCIPHFRICTTNDDARLCCVKGIKWNLIRECYRFNLNIRDGEESIGTDRRRRKYGSGDCAWRDGATGRAGRGAPACPEVRGGTGAGGAAAHEPRRRPRPAPPAPPPRSARTSAPLPPPHVARRSGRPLRRFGPRSGPTRLTTRHSPIATRDPHARSDPSQG